jgi:hypothetical protein
MRDKTFAGTAKASRDWATSSAGLFAFRAGTNPEYQELDELVTALEPLAAQLIAAQDS